MSGTPTRTPKARGRGTSVDVTAEYLSTATPNSHVVQDLLAYVVNGTAYIVDGHNVVLNYSSHEKEIAELLERELGGEIFMVPRVNSPEGVSTPDYLFRGEAFDLKTLGSEVGKNTIFNRIKKARRQAKSFVIDVTQAQLTEEVIAEQIEKVYKMKETMFVDKVIFISSGKIIKVVKRV